VVTTEEPTSDGKIHQRHRGHFSDEESIDAFEKLFDYLLSQLEEKELIALFVIVTQPA